MITELNPVDSIDDPNRDPDWPWYPRGAGCWHALLAGRYLAARSCQ